MIILTPKSINTEDAILNEYGRIGILLDRNVALISAIYSCFSNNITYVPLDLNWPDERINNAISIAQIDIVLTNKKYVHRLNVNVKAIVVDDRRAISFKKNHRPNETAYILFTSGSTGVPKGVEITRESLFNFIDGVSEIIDFSKERRIACLTTVSFDIFFLESIMALYKGLTIILADDDEQRNPKLMANLIKDNAVDMIQMTPSRMQLLLSQDNELSCLKGVKDIMIGGESFPFSMLRTLQEKTTAKIYNMYGPTETTIWSTISDLTHKHRIDIGRPIKNTEIYILNEDLSILPNGQVGEICIAGKGLASGYVGRDDLTAKNFIYLPQNPDVRIYRTGDMGRYLPDGDLECLGRIDNQVKIRGHRIELEEIESYLNQVDGINQSVVIAIETSETDKVLVAFYTSDINLAPKDISDYLLLKIPEYMIPAMFKRIESFIQMTNGKIDRKRVLECVEIKVYETTPEKSILNELNDVQRKAFEVIVSTLDSKIGDVTLETTLGRAGVDSITFVSLAIAFESEFGFEWDDEMLLMTKFDTVKSMIEYVESRVPRK